MKNQEKFKSSETPNQENQENLTGDEENIFQERDRFADEMWIGQDKERREVSPTEIARMDKNLVKLGELFKDTNVNWHLDGAINISLEKGEYIGVHKDIDIAVEDNELPDLEKYLKSKGYGLFLSYPKDPDDPTSKIVMERVGAQNFNDTGYKHPFIVAMDKNGKILDDQELNHIDVHIIKRDEGGNPLGRSESKLPTEWFKGKPIDFKGQEIYVSHPAKVAYYKIQCERQYDASDLKALAMTGALKEADIDNISEVLQQEYETRKQKASFVVENVIDKIEPKMDSEKIFNIFANQPEIKENMKGMEKQIRELSQVISNSKDLLTEKIVQSAFKIFKTEDMFETHKERIKLLRNWCREGTELKKTRENISANQ